MILVCSTVGRFINSYEWEQNGKIVGNNETLKLTIDASSGGIYTCTVSNAAGTDSASTTLYVEPFINELLNDLTTATNGSRVNINCDGAGFPAPNVSWVDALGLKVSNTSRLQLSPVMFGDEGLYSCELTTEIVGIHFSAVDETTLIGMMSMPLLNFCVPCAVPSLLLTHTSLVLLSQFLPKVALLFHHQA